MLELIPDLPDNTVGIRAIRRSVKAFGWLMPGDVKVFPVADLDGATAWIRS